MKPLKYILPLFLAYTLSLSAENTEYTPVVENLEMTFSADPDSLVNISYTIDRSAWRLPSNTEVELTPVVRFGNDSVTLPPVILAGRNAYLAHKRNDDLPKDADLVKAKGDPLQRTASIPWRPEMRISELSFLADTRGCRCRKEGETRLPQTLAMNFNPKPFICVMPPRPQREEKILIVSKSAFVNYKLGSDRLLSDYAHNAPELEEIVATIDSIRSNKEIRVDEVVIHGFASPEGPYDLNTRLAHGRAEALQKFVDEQYGFGHRIATYITPEDWSGLREWVKKSDLADRAAIIDIIDSKMEEDTKERTLRKRFPSAWSRMLTEAFPTLRRADYTIKYRYLPSPLPEEGKEAEKE